LDTSDNLSPRISLSLGADPEPETDKKSTVSISPDKKSKTSRSNKRAHQPKQGLTEREKTVSPTELNISLSDQVDVLSEGSMRKVIGLKKNENASLNDARI